MDALKVTRRLKNIVVDLTDKLVREGVVVRVDCLLLMVQAKG